MEEFTLKKDFYPEEIPSQTIIQVSVNQAYLKTIFQLQVEILSELKKDNKEELLRKKNQEIMEEAKKILERL